ncbi:Pca regulon regulatory protein [Labrenzia sp. THAF35]|uniref:IclR family transcriptional regulator domain-containing protein n=1 Tax=Labrenzia sp. THAF35 TaxID=2587854 RepID=UPI0012687AEC|nr:IclR family transcriptional regulator C-terminal domain-containing protein [Labrenzia sp. THAF35]QFT65534.1 Pca regulon regulatory protein [Labrenzia sp. THAF35]
MIAERDIMGGLAKGLQVIETFTADRPRQSISEVSNASGLDRATSRRCLLTLAHLGYANWDGKYFTLTPQVLRLGTACLATMPLPRVVQPLLDRLSEQIGESSSVSILDGDEIVYVARAARTKVMSIALMPGSRLPAHCSSMGRVMLAALPESEARARLEAMTLTALTPKTLTRVDAILAELASIRSQGFATIDQEVEPGLCSIAVPVQNSHGHTIAALNVGYASTSAAPETAKTKFLPALRNIQSELRPLLT